MRMVYQNLGTVWGIGVYADSSEELELWYNSLWNHGATNASMITEGWAEGFGYVLVQPEPEKNMLKYFENSTFHRLLNEAEEKGISLKGLKGGIMPEVREIAKQKLSHLMDNHEKWISTAPSTNFYNLGTIGGFAPTYC